MKICIVTGGTGGHIYPALALAEIWKKERDDSFLFIGNDDRMEAQLIPQLGYPFRALHTSGLSRNVLKSARAVAQMVRARSKARKILEEENVDLVIGFGGYVSAPVLMAARSLGIPYLIHEQNSISGKSNQLVSKGASAIICCYEKAEEYFPNLPVYQLGNPRASLVVNTQGDREYFESLGLNSDSPVFMVMMGSLGSSSVNDLMKEALADIDGVQILYVCGKNNPMEADAFDNPSIHVADYVDTQKIYPFLDGIICRAGATTLAEVTALGLPSILIPSPYVANNHQFYNADQLAQKGAAVVIEEKDLNGKTLKRAIEQAFLDEENRKAIANASRAAGKPNAARDMIDLALQIADKKHD